MSDHTDDTSDQHDDRATSPRASITSTTPG